MTNIFGVCHLLPKKEYTGDGLRDGSEKPGEGLCVGFEPDLQRTAHS
ncbi:MAG: hypothetical protein ABI416_20360 [Ginsengibacter sp.]